VSEPRIVCQFSCGAASAVATKLILAEFGTTSDVQIINAFIVEEHPDNRRFLADCERWFGRPVTVLRDERYGASVHAIWTQKQWIKNQYGAACSRSLKRDVLNKFLQENDILVLGFTAEEQDRFDNLVDRAPDLHLKAPLIERGLGKADCLAMIERAGIELPAMYKLGYSNNNCIGCCKGGEGYWNKIRVDFPLVFEAAAKIEEEVGATLFRNRKTQERYGLRQLPPDKGRHQDEPAISCSFFCELAEDEIV
jgi:3'-phosphoadenosine 5'-phosphosulfate sulfotransferase (PAPS reductase)/FAD synthetase